MTDKLSIVSARLPGQLTWLLREARGVGGEGLNGGG